MTVYCPKSCPVGIIGQTELLTSGFKTCAEFVWAEHLLLAVTSDIKIFAATGPRLLAVTSDIKIFATGPRFYKKQT